LKKRRRVPVPIFLGLCAVSFVVVNWCVQIACKPAELAGLLLPTTGKSPVQTWYAYGDLFERHATRVMTPELLAALAQVESSGDPAARTYWRWRWTLHPFQLFAPASSSVGLFQMTDGTFENCRKLCIHDGEVARAGKWYDPRACWFNGFYTRLIPSHAVEMTSACLEEQAQRLAVEGGRSGAPLAFKQDLAIVSHLCGPRAPVVDGLKRGKSVPEGRRCGDQDPRVYLRRVRELKRTFAELRG
jgi:hypothetical protein